jgi:hypothetical protein
VKGKCKYYAILYVRVGPSVISVTIRDPGTTLYGYLGITIQPVKI